MSQYYDQMVPLNASSTEFGGFITVLNEDFYIHITLDNSPKHVRVQGSWKLQQHLKPVEEILEKHVTQCSTILEMLQEIQSMLEQQLRKEQNNKPPSPPSLVYYHKLLDQLENCGWDKIHYISTCLSKLQLKTVDDNGREHFLHINLPLQFPNEAPQCKADVPGKFNFKWFPESTLLDLYKCFQTYLSKFSLFWNCMDELDQNTWILEPENPNKEDCKRRIALAATASLLIIVNPYAPTAVPECHFLGPERIVAPLRDKLNSNINNWNDTESLLYNLKMLMEIELPSPATSAKEDFCIECGICYTYQLGDALPDRSCEDPKCNQPFHHICLYEWLRTLSTARHSFSTIFGECPYCSKPITCTMP